MDALPVPSKGLLISHTPPNKFRGEWAPITKDWIPRGVWNVKEYCQFLLFGLVDYINTEHCLLVHWDGYAVNRRNWDDRFLDYDYIGSPWPKWLNPSRVGNGGFSLRSKRWLEKASQTQDWDGTPEDDWCCNKRRDEFEKAGLKIAPLSVASRWGIEHPVEEHPRRSAGDTFGFHGFFHPSTQLLRLFKQ